MPSRADVQRWIGEGRVSVSRPAADAAPGAMRAAKAADKVRARDVVEVTPGGARKSEAEADDGVVFEGTTFCGGDVTLLDQGDPGRDAEGDLGAMADGLYNGMPAWGTAGPGVAAGGRGGRRRGDGQAARRADRGRQRGRPARPGPIYTRAEIEALIGGAQDGDFDALLPTGRWQRAPSYRPITPTAQCLPGGRPPVPPDVRAGCADRPWRADQRRGWRGTWGSASEVR